MLRSFDERAYAMKMPKIQDLHDFIVRAKVTTYAGSGEIGVLWRFGEGIIDNFSGRW